MNLAIVGACALSFGTTRKKFGIEPFVSAAWIAEPDTNGSRGDRLKTGASASTSCEPAGPTTARTSASAWSAAPTRAARAGSSLRVGLDELDPLAAEPPDRVPREAQLLLAEERSGAGDRPQEAELRALAGSIRRRRGRPGR